MFYKVFRGATGCKALVGFYTGCGIGICSASYMKHEELK